MGSAWSSSNADARGIIPPSTATLDVPATAELLYIDDEMEATALTAALRFPLRVRFKPVSLPNPPPSWVISACVANRGVDGAIITLCPEANAREAVPAAVAADADADGELVAVFGDIAVRRANATVRSATTHCLRCALDDAANDHVRSGVRSSKK